MERRAPVVISLVQCFEQFVPDSQPELLLPFERTGADTVWRFDLPKAVNPFEPLPTSS